MRDRCWKTHKKREPWDSCPLCDQPLKWVYNGVEWMPCNREPILFILHPKGRNAVVYRRRIYDNAILYQPNNNVFYKQQPLQGYMQHYYTCPVLKQERKDYYKRRG